MGSCAVVLENEHSPLRESPVLAVLDDDNLAVENSLGLMNKPF